MKTFPPPKICHLNKINVSENILKNYFSIIMHKLFSKDINFQTNLEDSINKSDKPSANHSLVDDFILLKHDMI